MSPLERKTVDWGARSISSFDLVVTGTREVAQGVRLMTLCFKNRAALPGWSPGAHIDVFIPDLGPRQYSLCGDPSNHEEWAIAVQREVNGRGGSEWMHNQQVGSVLQVGFPRNHFPWKSAKSYHFVAGGIGITPLLPMIRSLSLGQDWRLLYGGRSLATMAFAHQIAASGGERVTLFPQDTHGVPALGQFLKNVGPDEAVYACGPPGMLNVLEAMAENWPPGLLNIERFTPRVLDSNVCSEFMITLARSGRTVQVGPHQTIVEALLQIGVRVTTVCKEGVCGTCETKVLEGIPDHRDSVLTREERALGSSMMVCCSRSLSQQLVLDL